MIIGNLDEEAKQLYDHLSPFCQCHLCADIEAVVLKMLSLVEPDVVVVPLPGSDSDPDNIFFLLDRDVHRPPIVAIGSVAIQSRLIKGRWLPSKRVIFLQRPIEMEDVVACVKGSLPQEAEPVDLPDLEELEEPGELEGLEELAERKERRPGERKKILVVDDDPSMVRVVHRMLAKYWDVSTATSGARAFVSISKSPPDLILLDYDMPVLDGRQTLQMLRSDKKTRDIPVVFLTGLSDFDHVEDVLSLQPQGYLLKPPSEVKLFQTLKSILGDA